MNKKLIGYRPPLSAETRKQIREIAEKLNLDALKEFTQHDVLVLAVDRAWCALFVEKVSAVKRKKYVKMPF